MRYFSLRQQLMLFILALFSFGLFYLKFHHPSPPFQETVFKEFVVEVVGEVRKPGVYLFQHAPTLKEAIDKAGGLKESILFHSDLSEEVLKTGTLISVQKITPSAPAEKGKSEEKRFKIKIGRMDANKLLVFNLPLDLNHVSAEDLCLISGIGDSLAREIIAYRDKRKAFRSVEELKQVKGMGEKNYQTVRPYLTVSPDP